MDPQWEPSSLFFLFFFYLNPHPSPISPSLSGSRLQSQSARPALAETHCGGADVSIDQEVCAPPIPTPTQTCTEARALAPEAPSTKTKVTWEEIERKKKKNLAGLQRKIGERLHVLFTICLVASLSL